jgi:hypothetical protein
MVLPQRGEPVLRAPPRGISRIDDDHVQPCVRRHLHQAVPEPPGGDAGDGAAEPAPAPPARRPVPRPLAALGAGVGEVEVLDHDRPRAVVFRGGDQAADRVPEPAVPRGGGQPGQVQRHRERGAGHVAVRGHDRDRQVPDIDVDRDNRMVPELLQRRDRAGGGLPARVDVPAAGRGAERDVVPDGAGGGLGGDLVTPVGELHAARQAVPAVRPVRQPRQRRGQLHLQPPLARMPPQGFIAVELVLLPISSEEPPGRLPLRPPLPFGQPGSGQVRPLAQQAPPAPRHRHRPRLYPPPG